MQRYNLIVRGDIEQAVTSFNDRNIEAVIDKAYYSEPEGMTALVVHTEATNTDRLDHQLNIWQSYGILSFYSPYWGKGETSPLT